MNNSLSRPDYRTTLNYADATNADIIDTVERNFPKAVEQTREFAKRFKGGSAKETAYNIWKFEKDHITYSKDPHDRQLIRLPSRFIHDGDGDCKSYALTAAALLHNNGLPVRFRYASYKPLNPIPSHVYVVTKDEQGRDIIVDGVYKYFDGEKKPSHIIDHPMNVYTLSDDVSGNRSVANRLAKRRARRKKKMRGSLQDNIKKKEYLRRLYGRHFRGQSLSELIEGIECCAEVHGMDGIYGKKKKKGFLRKIGKSLKKVGKAVKKLKPGQALKKISLAPGRRAYRTLVSINFGGLAKKLKRANDRDKAALQKKWKKIGGDYNALMKSVKKGYNHWAKKHKKQAMAGLYGVDLPILTKEAYAMGYVDDNTIGAAPLALPAILAAAAPIIAALVPILKKHDDPKDAADGAAGGETPAEKILSFAKDAVETYNTATGSGYGPGGGGASYDDPTDPKNEDEFSADEGESDEPASSSFKIAPVLLFGGAAVALYLVNKK